jgi:hypothetical protein
VFGVQILDSLASKLNPDNYERMCQRPIVAWCFPMMSGTTVRAIIGVLPAIISSENASGLMVMHMARTCVLCFCCVDFTALVHVVIVCMCQGVKKIGESYVANIDGLCYEYIDENGKRKSRKFRTAEEAGASWVSIRFCDHLYGIPKEEVSNIFTKMTPAEGGTR